VNDGEDVLSLGYDELIAPMIKAIQELVGRDTAQQEQVRTLQELVRSQQDVIGSLLARLAALETGN
jgi:hypothetical protein